MTTNQLKETIVAAFPSGISLTHADCIELRTKLSSLRDEDVLLVLGPVLVDLLDTHGRSTEKPDWTDSVVRFFCSAAPPLFLGVPYLPNVAKALDQFGRSQKSEAERLFNKFTVEQARASYYWLEAVSLWRGSGGAEDELSAAMKYWGDKISSSQ